MILDEKVPLHLTRKWKDNEDKERDDSDVDICVVEGNHIS